MNILFGIIIGLFVLMVLITAHEFGHFLMARKNGVKITEFAIGFPPRAIAWKKDEKNHRWHKIEKLTSPKNPPNAPPKSLILSLNYLPIGGFCQMYGESATDDRPGTFGHASFWAKTKILFGGVLMNWLVAWIVLSTLAFTGLPTFLPNQFHLQSDTISYTKADRPLTRATWSAPIVGAGLTAQLTAETLKGIGQLTWNLLSGLASQLSFSPAVRESGQKALSSASDSVSGPVGIIGVIFPAFTSAGPTSLALLSAIISVSLACMNILPIPALDGGRWLLIAIYKLRKKPLDQATEEKIVSRAFSVLLFLVLLVTILDIVKLF